MLVTVPNRYLHSLDHAWDDEEILSRKERKQEIKELRKNDRSKYKKTDQKMLLKAKEVTPPAALKGFVLSIISHQIEVESISGNTYLCSLRGLLKKEKTQEKNPIIVGDEVLFEPLTEKEGLILSVLPRRSLLSRQDNLHRIKKHLIAANVDQVLITQSCVLPALKSPIIDRYLIAAEKGGITPVLVFNKIDLLADFREEEKLLFTLTDMYRNLGIDVFLVSAKTGEGLEALRKKMENKTSVFSGQSGTGKTSLINALTGLKMTTASAIVATNKGAHTTSSAKLLKLSFGGYCVDTPGIRSFGVWDLEPEDLRHYFEDFLQFSHLCMFRDCSHRHEPGCHIQKLVEEDKLSPIRYESYLNLYDSLKETHLLR